MSIDWLDVSATTPRIAYTATASQTVFTVPFAFFENADLFVYQNTVLLTLDVDYTVTGAEVASGGEVTLVTGATVGDIILIVRHVEIVQTTHIPPSGPLDVPAINIQISKLIAISQQLDDNAERTLHLPDSDPILTGELAPVATRKNKLLGFDTDGSIIYPVGPDFVGDTATGVAVIDSRSTAQVTTFNVSVNVIRTEGLVVPGDGGGAEYIRGLVGDPGAFQDGGEVYWKFASIPGAVVEIDSRATAAASSFPANVNILNTYGLATPGDGGGATYVRGTVSSPGAFQDASGQYWGVATTGGGSSGGVQTPGGRLTLTSGNPEMPSSVTAATTLYYAPYAGDRVPIFTNGVGTMYPFTASATDAIGLSIVLGSNWAANSNFDVFVALNGTTVTLGTGPDWSAGAVPGSNTVGASVRGTGAGSTDLQIFGGFLTNKNAITLRKSNSTTFNVAANEAFYLGTFRTGSAGQISFTYGAEGTAGTFNLWNCYNQILANSTSSDGTASWTYSSATIRQSNNSSTNQFNFVTGLATGNIVAGCTQNIRPASSVAATGRTGIALNSTTVLDKFGQVGTPAASVMDASATVQLNYKPQLGANFISQNEKGDGSTTATFFGQGLQELSVSLWM